MALQIGFIAAVTCILLGIYRLLKTQPDSGRPAGMLVAAGLTIAGTTAFFLYKDGDGNSLIFYPLLAGLLAVGCLLAWIISLQKSKPAGIQMLHLLQVLAGAVSVFVAVYAFQNIIKGGLAFPADTEENLPGFVFIFGNFGHADTLMLVMALALGAMCFSGGIIAWLQYSRDIKQWTFKGYQRVGFLLVAILVGYCGFVVWQVPITTGNFGFALTATDGLQANAGLYDAHVYLFYAVLPLALVCGLLLSLMQMHHKLPVLTTALEILGGITAVIVGIIKHQNAMLTTGLYITVAGMVLMMLLLKVYRPSFLK